MYQLTTGQGSWLWSFFRINFGANVDYKLNISHIVRETNFKMGFINRKAAYHAEELILILCLEIVKPSWIAWSNFWENFYYFRNSLSGSGPVHIYIKVFPLTLFLWDIINKAIDGIGVFRNYDVCLAKVTFIPILSASVW